MIIRKVVLREAGKRIFHSIRWTRVICIGAQEGAEWNNGDQQGDALAVSCPLLLGVFLVGLLLCPKREPLPLPLERV